MSTTISQLTQSLTSSTANDFLVLIDSASLTTFKSTISAFNTWSSDSGSFLSASFSSQSFLADTASLVITASNAKSSSVILNLKYDGSAFNGTASYAISSSFSLTSSFSKTSISASTSLTTSFATLAATASNVISTSYALFSPSATSASVAISASSAATASYINITTSSLDFSFERAYGPFTSSNLTNSVWSCYDLTDQGIPLIILKDDTEILFKARVSYENDEVDDSPTVFWTVEARLLPLTESTAPGIYRTSSYNDTLGSADVYHYIRGRSGFAPSGYGAYTQLLQFRKTGLAKGQYTLWLTKREYSNSDTITFTDRAHFKDGNDFGALESGQYVVDSATPSWVSDTPESWFLAYSGSQKVIAISTNPVIQGCMFAPTSSWGQVGGVENYYGTRNANYGRPYVLPFLVDSASISAGFCSASCNFWSGSKYFTASFMVGTSGKALNDVVYASQSALPAVANFWTTSVVVKGTPLASIPIRLEYSTSWIPTA